MNDFLKASENIENKKILENPKKCLKKGINTRKALKSNVKACEKKNIKKTKKRHKKKIKKKGR